jgi:hypothetical protein
MLGTIVFVVVGAALLVAASVMLYFRGRAKEKAAFMGRVETSSAAEAATLAPGSVVEVKGTLRCEAPQRSEMANEACAYYSARVIREYIDDSDEDDVGSDRRSETLSHSERFAPFSVEDATGRVAVNAEGAEVDARQMVDRFERHTDGASISFAGSAIRLGGGERTIGYRYTESILPVDSPVYVLGVVGHDGGIGAPTSAAGDTRFVVSHRSEEALGEQIGKDARLLGLVAAGRSLFGLVFVAVGVAAAAGYIQFQ